MSTGYFIARRLILFIPVFIMATLIAYGITYLLPGNVAIAILGEHATPERIASLESQLGLDRSFFVQYFDWFKGVIQGDLGESLYRRVPVFELILPRLPVTLLIVFLAKFWSSLFGIGLAVASVMRPNSAVDAIARFISVLGQSLPAFIVGLILVLVISMYLGLLPISGYVDFFKDPLGSIKYLILPVIAVGAPGMAAVTRQMRSALLEILQEDYIKIAFLKGYSRLQVIWKHALKNGMIPVVTVIATGFITAMGGAVIIESMFVIPGLGRLVVNSIMTKDFPLILGIIVTNVVIVLIINLATDIVYKILDPRIEY